MNKQPIHFKDVAARMGMEESRARISMATPVVHDDVLQYRAFCIAELIIKRVIENGQLKAITCQTWGEVRRCFTLTDSKVIALIQWNSSPQTFPLEIPMKALVGHKDAIVQSIRKMERELPIRLRAWSEVTKNGLLQFPSSQVLLRQMIKYHQKLVS